MPIRSHEGNQQEKAERQQMVWVLGLHACYRSEPIVGAAGCGTSGMRASSAKILPMESEVGSLIARPAHFGHGTAKKGSTPSRSHRSSRIKHVLQRY
jgi:hypothetical protein